MTTFPSISPTVRTYVPGNVPIELQAALDGGTVGFKRGARRVNQVLSLTFSHLTQENMVLIKDHYIARKGTFEIFFLPSAIWGDYTTSPVGLNYAWRYSEPPVIEDVSFDRFTVSVALETISINTSDLVFEAKTQIPTRLYANTILMRAVLQRHQLAPTSSIRG